MTTEIAESDQAARGRALDAAGSFVVQAPAGSGKTSLLTQRLLALLAHVELPEEILAITFTRKAAGEMRSRVVEALRAAASPTEPDDHHQRLTWTLAQRALVRSRERGWSLELQPSRLKIRTIDALAQSLAGAMPVLSRAGAALEVEPEARSFYDEATLRLMGELEEGGGVARDLATVLEHFDNDYEQVRSLFADMLERRDQWLPSILEPGHGRARMEGSLRRVAAEALNALAERLPATLRDALWRSAIAAASRLADADDGMRALAQLQGPVNADPAWLACWQALARLVLVGGRDRFRKTVDKNSGFPPSHRAEKTAHLALLADMAAIPGALEAWCDVAFVPPPAYEEGQWRVIAALLALLKRLTAHLRVIFAERGRVDYTEVALAGREALGPPDEPTDLALRLDYRIRHILVDEFQDTSLAQIELLRRLTAGWTGSDGRTLFCVGDPMQSIYRFRQADVALFLRVRRHGIDNLRPGSLTLARNFRSQAGVVDWVNRVFATILPAADDFAKGAVRYTPVQATRASSQSPAVRLWPAIELDPVAEAERVVSIVRSIQARSAHLTIAVLARTRSHMHEIARALRAGSLSFQAIDFEVLAERRAVRDLSALTRALCHRDDRVAWLAVLRSPFCGLPLGDLELLGANAAHRTIWDALLDSTVRARLSADARTIAARVVPALDTALDKFGSRPLATLVEGAWLALGGPASVEEPADLENARVFFDRLATQEHAGDLADPVVLDEALGDLHAAPDAAASERLQLITIHKAKGLEWDVVIVPGLGRRPRGDGRRLLYTLELEHADSPASLIFAPARAAAVEGDPLEAFVRRIEKDRATLENARLMYVAATRAREELHLLGHVTAKEDEELDELEPAANSLLKVLWPALRGEFTQVPRPASRSAAAVTAPTDRRSLLSRLAPDWQSPAPPARPQSTEREIGDADRRPDFDWVTEIARLVGIVVHRDLERRVRLRLLGLEALSIDPLLYTAELRELGAPQARLAAAAGRVALAIRQTLDDERGRWILAAHGEEASEWALTAEIDGELNRLVVDRSFVDDHGVRWIIDYKTSTHEGSSLEGFLAQEAERYAPQLARYVAVVARLGPQPVRAGLYFPLLGAWRELVLAG
ncbi:MAG TPA: UvrD-helicase domain-containing protein [Steroidobacteraceae bacterium]|nr:UvrD-helicase domain-containing protein [Steroidobacteraceae bacterium]